MFNQSINQSINRILTCFAISIASFNIAHAADATDDTVFTCTHTLPNRLDTQKHLLLHIESDNQYITIDRAFACNHFKLLKDFAEYLSEPDSQDTTSQPTEVKDEDVQAYVIPLSNPEHSTIVLVDLLKYLRALDNRDSIIMNKMTNIWSSDSQLTQTHALLHLADFLNVTPASCRLQMTFNLYPVVLSIAAKDEILLKSPSDHTKTFVDCNPSLARILYHQLEQDHPFRAWMRAYCDFPLDVVLAEFQNHGDIFSKISVSNDIVDGWSHTQAMDPNNPINQLFAANPDAELIIDFGNKTEISRGFGVYEDKTSFPNNFTDIDSWHISTIPNQIKNIIINGGLTNVGDYFLDNCQSLETVDLSDTIITQVGCEFLKRCTSLTSVHLPSTLENVGFGFLMNCTSLRSFPVLTALKEVNGGFLNDCGSLETVDLSQVPIQKIGRYFLSGCRVLKKVMLPSTIEIIAPGFLEACPHMMSGSLVVTPGSTTENTLKQHKEYEEFARLMNPTPTLADILVDQFIKRYFSQNALLNMALEFAQSNALPETLDIEAFQEALKSRNVIKSIFNVKF